MSFPVLLVLIPLAWIAGTKLINWAYNREQGKLQASMLSSKMGEGLFISRRRG